MTGRVVFAAGGKFRCQSLDPDWDMRAMQFIFKKTSDVLARAKRKTCQLYLIVCSSY